VHSEGRREPKDDDIRRTGADPYGQAEYWEERAIADHKSERKTFRDPAKTAVESQSPIAKFVHSSNEEREAIGRRVVDGAIERQQAVERRDPYTGPWASCIECGATHPNHEDGCLHERV
jgi:hypothetical protein